MTEKLHGAICELAAATNTSEEKITDALVSVLLGFVSVQRGVSELQRLGLYDHAKAALRQYGEHFGLELNPEPQPERH